MSGSQIMPKIEYNEQVDPLAYATNITPLNFAYEGEKALLKKDYKHLQYLFSSFPPDWSYSICKDGNTPLHIAALMEDEVALKMIINTGNYSWPIQNKENPKTHLTVADIVKVVMPELYSCEEYKEIFIPRISQKPMLSKRIDPSDIDFESQKYALNGEKCETTDLHKAVKGKKYDTVRGLLETDSKKINQRDEEGNTALYYAYLNHDIEMMHTLFCFNANANLENKEGISVARQMSEKFFEYRYWNGAYPHCFDGSYLAQ